MLVVDSAPAVHCESLFCRVKRECDVDELLLALCLDSVVWDHNTCTTDVDLCPAVATNGVDPKATSTVVVEQNCEEG